MLLEPPEKSLQLPVSIIYYQKHIEMTEEQRKEIEDFLLAKGVARSAVKIAVNAAEIDDLCKQYKDSDEAKRYQELRKFEPNPGEAQLTPVGKVHEGITYLEDPSPNSDKEKLFRSDYEVKKTGGNIPVYQEDIDMVKKAIPLAKKILDMQKMREDVGAIVSDAYNLPQGPDTTENIQEVVEKENMHEVVAEEVYNPREEVTDALTEDQKRYYTRLFSGIEKKGYDRTMQELREYEPEEVKYEHPEVEEYRKRVDHGFVASERYVPKPGTKGMMKVQPGIFDRILEQMSDVHRRKNADYGDAAYEGYKEFGIQYYIIQLHNKLKRLKSLTKEGYQPQVSESIEDTLLDMANYAVLALEALKRED